jgi:glycosyltransferase involved in cell wall biosynthesis
VARLAYAVAKVARSFEVLYANSQKGLVVACAASLLSRRPVLWAMHDILDLEHFSRRSIRLNVTLANRFATRVIANSRATAGSLTQWGLRKDKVHVVYCGFNPVSFPSLTDAEITATRAELGLSPGPLVGVFGRLTRWKGQHVVLEALAVLPGVHVLFVGEAFDTDDYVLELRRRAEELQVSDRIHFLGFRADVDRLMRLVDVVLHTSIAPEPFGRVIVEGMLAGRPVIAARGGGVPEIVEDGVSGLLVTPGDPRELAAAVTDLLQQPRYARDLAAAGQARAVAEFPLDRMLREVSRHVNEVATTRSIGPVEEVL